MCPDFLSKKKFAVARSRMESSQVFPLGGHLDCSTLKLSGHTFYITPQQSRKKLASELAATAKSTAVMEDFMHAFEEQMYIPTHSRRLRSKRTSHFGFLRLTINCKILSSWWSKHLRIVPIILGNLRSLLVTVCEACVSRSAKYKGIVVQIALDRALSTYSSN